MDSCTVPRHRTGCDPRCNSSCSRRASYGRSLRSLYFVRPQLNPTLPCASDLELIVPQRARAKSLPRILEFRIALRDVEPEVWRQVLVPDDFSLDEFHRVLQECFGWMDHHLYSFLLDGVEYEAPDEEAEGHDATQTTLASLALQADSTLEYTYDFGDNWVHDIRLVAAHPSNPEVSYPWCVDGARAGPPEDAGGPPGYADLLRSLADPTDPEFLASRTWVGAHFHPDTFDLRATNRILALAFPARAR